MSQVKIHPSWKLVLTDQFEQPYFQALATKLRQAKTAGTTIYPPGSLIFNAFDSTPFEEVKVVILGQDPYHNPGQAMGLSFSVPKGVTIPPSLRNIYKEINEDLSLAIPNHGDLSEWAAQGVFLLNAMLTVEKKKPASHQKIGWQNFTDAAISALSVQREHLVFMLWGAFARKKAILIDANKHCILESPHPSPFSADRGFFGNKHFSKANEYLLKNGKSPIDWSIKS